MLKSMTFRSTLAAVACAISFSAHSMADSPKTVEIPAGDLRPALLQLSKTFGVELFYQPSQLDHFQTAGVKGSYTPEAAVRLLLKGTPLELRTDPSGAMMVIDPKAPRAAAVSALSEQVPPSSSSGENSQSRSSLQLAQTTPGTSASPTSVNQRASKSQQSSESLTLEEVVVTAQKREERLKDVPISIAVLGGQQLDQSTVQGVAQALDSVPGVASSTSFQGGGSILGVRGVTAGSPTFGGSSTTAYYLDSVPFGLVDSAIAPDANAYDLDRVEVLRGPQGTLYGAGGEGGVIRVLTHDADLQSFELKGRATGSGTEYGGANYGADLAINAPIVQDKLAVRAVVDYQNLSGWIDKPTQRDANDAQLRNARLKVNAQPTDQLSIGLSAWVSRQNYGAPSIGDDQRQSTHIADEPITVDYEAYGAKVSYNFQAVSLTSMTSYLNFREADTLDFGIDYLGGISYPLSERFDGNVFSQEINLSSNTSGPWRWTAGAIYRDAQNNTSQVLPAAFIFDWTAYSKSYAIFGELSRRFLDNRFEWTLGARYFHDDVTSKEDHAAPPLNPTYGYYRAENSFNSTTPRAVLTWYPRTDAMVYASYSEGFRSGAPQIYILVGGVPGFPPVKPDKLHNYEIGTKADFLDKRLSVDAAVYYMKWNDVQQTIGVRFRGTPVAALINGSSASGPGVDFGLTVRPLEKLELGATVSWNDLTIDSDVFSGGALLFAKGDRLNLSPEYTWGAFADYTLPLGGSGYEGKLSTSAHYTSELGDRTVTGGAQSVSEGNPILISRVGLSIVAPKYWEATVFVDNLNNDQGAVFRNPALGHPLPNYDVRVRPRTVGVQFDYRQ